MHVFILDENILIQNITNGISATIQAYRQLRSSHLSSSWEPIQWLPCSPSYITAMRYWGFLKVSWIRLPSCREVWASQRPRTKIAVGHFTPRLENLTFVVQEVGVSRHNGGLINGLPLKPLHTTVLWCLDGFRGPLISPTWCREPPASRTAVQQILVVVPHTEKYSDWFGFKRTFVWI